MFIDCRSEYQISVIQELVHQKEDKWEMVPESLETTLINYGIHCKMFNKYFLNVMMV